MANPITSIVSLPQNTVNGMLPSSLMVNPMRPPSTQYIRSHELQFAPRGVFQPGRRIDIQS